MIRERKDVVPACSEKGIPDYMHGAVERYLFDHIEMGSFGNAVVSNNLTEAFRAADTNNREAMFGWAMLLYNDFPRNAWGSAEIVEKWLDPGT